MDVFTNSWPLHTHTHTHTHSVWWTERNHFTLHDVFLVDKHSINVPRKRTGKKTSAHICSLIQIDSWQTHSGKQKHIHTWSTWQQWEFQIGILLKALTIASTIWLGRTRLFPLKENFMFLRFCPVGLLVDEDGDTSCPVSDKGRFVYGNGQT